MFAADSTKRAPMTIRLDVCLRPLGMMGCPISQLIYNSKHSNQCSTPFSSGLMRSSTPSTNMISEISAMYGHTFITNGHDPLPCAYNAHNANPAFTADMESESTKIIPGLLIGVSQKIAL